MVNSIKSLTRIKKTCVHCSVMFSVDLIMLFMIVPGVFVSSSFLISVCMFIVPKALLISSATVIVHAGEGIWLNPFATVLVCVVPSL